jgi:hypothetical protein
MARLPKWQFRQIANALKLLFKAHIKLGWAAHYEWRQWRVVAFQAAINYKVSSMTAMGRYLTSITPLSILAEYYLCINHRHCGA